MNQRHPVLRPDLAFSVREHELVVSLGHDLPAKELTISPMAGLLLLMFDGTKSESQVAEDVARKTGLPYDKSCLLLKSVLERYGHLLEAEARSPRADRESLVKEVASLFEGRQLTSRARHKVPSRLSWIVSTRCPHHCLYCYSRPGSLSSDTEPRLTRQRVSELLQEASAIGTRAVRLTGGEPFCRPGIYGMIADAVRHGLEVELITKWRFTVRQAQELAQTGLKTIAVSLDCADPGIGDWLVGTPGYVESALASITRLSRAGLQVTVECVVLHHTVNHLERLIEVAALAGATQIVLTEYTETPAIPQAGQFRLTDADRVMCTQAARKHPQFVVLASGRPLVEPCCDIGVSELCLLPDGRVVTCTHLAIARLSPVILGSLEKDSILTVWNSLGAIYPRELFLGTECFSCTLFDRCNARGRCLVSALQRCGRLFGPHQDCPVIGGRRARVPLSPPRARDRNLRPKTISKTGLSVGVLYLGCFVCRACFG